MFPCLDTRKARQTAGWARLSASQRSFCQNLSIAREHHRPFFLFRLLPNRVIPPRPIPYNRVSRRRFVCNYFKPGTPDFQSLNDGGSKQSLSLGYQFPNRPERFTWFTPMTGN